MKYYNEPIPDGKLGQFDEILKACGGRYLSNPVETPPSRWGRWRVSYEYNDIEAANEHSRRWQRVTTDIKESIRLSWWKRLVSWMNTESSR
jgi:hypothetical protein